MIAEKGFEMTHRNRGLGAVGGLSYLSALWPQIDMTKNKLLPGAMVFREKDTFRRDTREFVG